MSEQKKINFVFTQSAESAMRKHLDLAKRAELRVKSSLTPESDYCKELLELARLHREAASIFSKALAGNPVKWNPFNRVVQDHRDGTIDHEATNQERAKRGLPIPWTPKMGHKEVKEAPVE